ncbi:MAG TPA: hypothetical protein VLF64_03015 [Candidatus Saccharimonadales bacterium]|nr:hypothetical protein [Candidatus Saccharimonadales bacterium]
MDNQALLDDLSLEKSAKERFGVALDVDSVIVRHIDVGQSAYATLFLSSKKQLYCYIDGPTKLLLSDIKKIVSRMGLRPELFFPPKGRHTYFDDIGRAKFREVFPGRRDVHDNDIIFYRTLAPYSPALVLVSEVKGGVVYQVDHDARGGWRPAVKFAYRRIKTS